MRTRNKIENITELRAQILQLQNDKEEQERQIKKDIHSIRDDWKPENILWSTLSSALGIKINKNNFFKEGMAHGLSVLIQRIILKMEKKMENKTYSFVDILFEKLKSILDKFVNHEAKREERKEGLE